MRDEAVYICEVTYAKQPRALSRRLQSWREHWPLIHQTLKEDASIDKDWPIIPWVFPPKPTLDMIKPELQKLLQEARTTDLADILPWLYCTYDRKPEAHDETKDERPAPATTG